MGVEANVTNHSSRFNCSDHAFLFIYGDSWIKRGTHTHSIRYMPLCRDVIINELIYDRSPFTRDRVSNPLVKKTLVFVLVVPSVNQLKPICKFLSNFKCPSFSASSLRCVFDSVQRVV